MIRITYFRDKCIGCGVCCEIAPFRWRMSKKDGKSTLLQGKKKNDVFQAVVDNDEMKDNELAADNCPVNIIRILAIK
jgi:ferredoxin